MTDRAAGMPAESEHIAQLREAPTSRAVIDEANVIIMGAHRIPADEAFPLDNITVRGLAARLVADVVGSTG